MLLITAHRRLRQDGSFMTWPFLKDNCNNVKCSISVNIIEMKIKLKLHWNLISPKKTIPNAGENAQNREEVLYKHCW